MKLTENERILLTAIRDSDYHDGRHPVGSWVWVDCVCQCLGNTRTASGTMSSLVQKGLARTNRESCTITEAGFNALIQ